MQESVAYLFRETANGGEVFMMKVIKARIPLLET
jgi:hypothetical protein